MKMVVCIGESGEALQSMAGVLTPTQVEPGMKENGETGSKRGEECIFSHQEVSMKENGEQGNKKDWG